MSKALTGYNEINLANMIGGLEEERINKILSSYLCPMNQDITMFLHQKALEFAKQNLAATYIVMTSHKGSPVLIGYYTLAQKTFFIPDKTIPSQQWRRRIGKFGTYNKAFKGFQLSSPLIAQLGKNYNNGYDRLISGDELLKMACDKVREIQKMSSGKLAYIECEDNEKLIKFYESNGFILIHKRKVEKEELTENGPDYLAQLIRYMR